jgi:hypothetical protein
MYTVWTKDSDSLLFYFLAKFVAFQTVILTVGYKDEEIIF